MSETDASPLPKWAPRVSKAEIERLYRGGANGLLDEEIIDEVGCGLYARCASMLVVAEIQRTGCPRCPVCEAVLPRRKWQPNEQLACPNCDWTCPADKYYKTFSRKNLGTGGLDAFILEFMRGFESARSPGDKLIFIDTLVHRFHWSSEQGRPMAAMLIEGNMKGTMAFLDRLSYGDAVPGAVQQTRDEWRRTWAKNKWSHGKGQ